MASNDIGEWYRSIPQITKYWFTGSVVLPIIARVGLISPLLLILRFDLVVYNFQIWRIITSVLYYPISGPRGFHYLLSLYFLYSYSVRLETGIFDGRPADYVFMLLFNLTCLVIIGFIANIMLLMDPMVLSVLYIWCQLNKETVVTFWFSSRFKAMYLPWVLLAFNLVIGDGYLAVFLAVCSFLRLLQKSLRKLQMAKKTSRGLFELIGILVGHLYFFLMFKYPLDFGGARLINTPQFLYKYFPSRRGGTSGFGMSQPNRQRPEEENPGGGARGSHAWGRGHTLGNN